MDPVTLGLIFGGVNMLKGMGQQKQQQAMDEVDAKWKPFSGQTHSKAAEKAPWINDLMSVAFLANGAGGGKGGMPDLSGLQSQEMDAGNWESLLKSQQTPNLMVG